VSIAADGIRVWSLGEESVKSGEGVESVESDKHDWRQRLHIVVAEGAPTKVDFEGGVIATANGHSVMIWDIQDGLLLHTIPQTVIIIIIIIIIIRFLNFCETHPHPLFQMLCRALWPRCRLETGVFFLRVAMARSPSMIR